MSVLSIQETNLQAIADAIRQKDGTSEAIMATDFAERILAIPTGGGFAVPLTVTVEAGALVTAVNGDSVITATSSQENIAELILTKPGIWAVTASLDGEEKSTEINVAQGYETKFNIFSRVPEGYTEVEYISNPNKGYIRDAGIPNNVANCIIELKADFTETTANGYLCGNSYDNGQRVNSSGSYRYYYSQYVSRLQFVANTNTLCDYVKYYSLGNIANQLTTSELAIPHYDIAVEKDGVHTIRMNYPNSLFEVDGEEVTTRNYQASSSLPELPFAIFAQNNQSKSVTATTATTTYGQTPCDYRLHSLQITDSETGDLINDFVPCISPDDVAGLYDVISGNFYSSYIASKQFVPGPVI